MKKIVAFIFILFVAIVLSEYHSVFSGYVRDDAKMLFFIASVYVVASIILFLLKSLFIKEPSTKALRFNIIYSLVAVLVNVPIVVNPDYSLVAVWGYLFVGLNFVIMLFFIMFNIFTIKK